MKVLIQRVKKASVTIDNKLYSEIESGILALVGIEKGDSTEQVEKLAKKIVNLRIFPDENDKMNLSVKDVGGSIIFVPNFTLYGDARHGRRPGYSYAAERKKGTRPSFDKSAPPEVANELYEYFIKEVQSYGIKTGTGVFGAMMEVELINDGPVTFMLEAHNG